MPSPARPIPVYALYGEGDGVADPGFAHIETIHSRSRLHDWEIAPHRHALLAQILLIRRSVATVTIDGVTTACAGPVAIATPAGVTHGFRFDPGVEGDVLSLCPALLAAEADPATEELMRPLRDWPAIIALDPESAERAARLTREIARECAAPRAGSTAMVTWLVRALLLLLARRHAELALEKRRPGRQTIPFARFRALVEQHFREQHGLAFYAAELGLTERSVNRLATRGAGRSAKRYLIDRLVLEARRQLAYTAAPIATIAYDLGFEDPSYFSRFYRRATGRLPSADRRP
jgi:AraC family transcriptional activator of pobA